MTEIINKLNQEIAELERIIQQLKQNLCTYPEGTLQINRSNGSIQYYRRNCRQLSPVETPIRRQYIRKEQQELVRNLAQKDYDQRLLKILENRLKAASKMKDVYMQADPTEVYEKCHSERKKLIIPQFISDEEYAEKWQNVKDKGKEFAEGMVEIYTVKGERVRSKSEKILADLFERKNIPYRYEYPLKLLDSKIIYPDFTILNKRTRKVYYWEHLGMMDDAEYAENAIKRIQSMEASGILPGKNLLIMAETKQNPISIKSVNILIQEYLI